MRLKKSSRLEPPGRPKATSSRAVRDLPNAQARLDWDPLGLIAGVDEAGRGPLAGPVVAAAVILDDARRIRGLADSKVLTPLQRDHLYDQICEKALCCSVAQASVEEIDTLNILQATMLAMKRAVEGLRLKPAKVMVDGNRLPVLDVLAEAVIGGDAKIKSISAASILAKVHRDRLCQTLHEEFPQYGFASHKGYGTPEHLEALRVHGACRHHRKFFGPVAATFSVGDDMVVVEDGMVVTVTLS
jgi:ribonuclease HII